MHPPSAKNPPAYAPESDKVTRIMIDAGIPILQALKKMDELRVKLLLVIENEAFTGLLSIGTIQQALIQNRNLDQPVKTILRTDPILAYTDEPVEDIRLRMLQHRTEFMPVLDRDGVLHYVYFWADIMGLDSNLSHGGNLNIPVVIMAGGKGTRLAPITNVLPKPLIPIGDKTILEHILDRFVQVNCCHFLISVNYKAEMIRHYFDNLANPKYRIEYFKEEKFLGTVGSLYLLKGHLNSTFFISNCDIIIDSDYLEIYNYHKEQQNDITIVGALKHFPIPYGVLETKEDGVLTSLQEKPELTFKINSGMYLLEPGMLDYIPENKHFHITELIELIRGQGGKVGVFPVNEGAWMDIGEWSEYNKTSVRLGYSQIFG